MREYDAIVYGAGFYGLSISLFLRETKKMRKILVIEQEHSIMNRASRWNQARIHSGFHYPRSFLTAKRSQVNMPIFINEWREAVYDKFKSYYVISNNQSKVNNFQFEKFCQQFGGRLLKTKELDDFFNKDLIGEIYQVEEFCFNSEIIKEILLNRIKQSSIEIELGKKVNSIYKTEKNLTTVLNDSQELSSKYVFNCTYAGLNSITGDFKGISHKLKIEKTEMLLSEPPPEFMNIGITVMDGPFFSIMPFPSKNLHSISHVKYTPHSSWIDFNGSDNYKLCNDQKSNQEKMIRDIKRYFPTVEKYKITDAFKELKAVLDFNEIDDGRPILVERDKNLKNMYNILGGKIDNIYDILEYLNKQNINI